MQNRRFVKILGRCSKLVLHQPRLSRSYFGYFPLDVRACSLYVELFRHLKVLLQCEKYWPMGSADLPIGEKIILMTNSPFYKRMESISTQLKYWKRKKNVHTSWEQQSDISNRETTSTPRVDTSTSSLRDIQLSSLTLQVFAFVLR